MIYVRDVPYTTQQYLTINTTNPITTVYITIMNSSSKFDITKINETYTINVNASGIYIVADNTFGLARAFATLT